MNKINFVLDKINNRNKEIKLIEKKIYSLLDLGLESKIENKMNELTKEKNKFQKVNYIS